MESDGAAQQWAYENGFYQTSHPSRLAKALAQYDLYKLIVGLPGAVVECGVFKGGSLIRWATFCEILESPHARRLIGFDAFGAFPPQTRADDTAFITDFEATCGSGLSLQALQHLLTQKGFDNVELVQGDVCTTVPRYLEAHPALRIALLHLDVDVYAPTQMMLRRLYGRVVRGGLIVLDNYGTVTGETLAVDEFCGEHPEVQLAKLPLAHAPTYIRKP